MSWPSGPTMKPNPFLGSNHFTWPVTSTICGVPPSGIDEPLGHAPDERPRPHGPTPPRSRVLDSPARTPVPRRPAIRAASAQTTWLHKIGRGPHETLHDVTRLPARDGFCQDTCSGHVHNLA